MFEERFFVTGAMGCIGAWVAANLVHAGVPTTAFDLSTNRSRLELLMDDSELAEIVFVHGDIADADTVAHAVLSSRATHIIHLAALQVPFCKANPAVGAAVNVVGTVNVYEAAKRAGIEQIVYASSLAVYGRKEEYNQRLLAHDAHLHPLNHYGVYKQANEGTAQIYWQDDSISSIGLRPYIVYGPARDQGLTSTPTKAMLAAARGEPYHISFGGVYGFQYTDDVAKLFVRAARTPFRGAEAFNIKGSVANVGDVVAAIEACEPGAAGRITFEDAPLPFPEGQEDDALRTVIGDIVYTPLENGVAQTIEHFKRAMTNGRLPKNTSEELEQ
jgi:nucleoside-diphosphate-sugar epimerase